MKRIALALALGMSVLAPAAQAATLTWTFYQTTLGDGGTAIGSFDFNPDTAVLSDIGFHTTDGSSFAGASYSAVPVAPAYSPSSGNLYFATGTQTDYTGSTLLYLEMVDDLTDFGGTLPFYITEYQCLNATCLEAEPLRSDTGFITTLPTGGLGVLEPPSSVPEPASITLLCIGSMAIVLWHLRAIKRNGASAPSSASLS